MTSVQESNKNYGFMCCRPWGHRGHPASGSRFGVLLVAIGLIWLGSALGWIDLSWLRSVPFWPMAFILFGGWLLYHGLTGEKPEKKSDREKREV